MLRIYDCEATDYLSKRGKIKNVFFFNIIFIKLKTKFEQHKTVTIYSSTSELKKRN